MAKGYLFISAVPANKTFATRLTDELLAGYGKVVSGGDPNTATPSTDMPEKCAAVVPVISPEYLASDLLEKVKSFCALNQIPFIAVTDYPYSSRVPELDEAPIQFSGSNYHNAFMLLTDELKRRRVRINVASPPPAEHTSPPAPLVPPSKPFIFGYLERNSRRDQSRLTPTSHSPVSNNSGFPRMALMLGAILAVSLIIILIVSQ